MKRVARRLIRFEQTFALCGNLQHRYEAQRSFGAPKKKEKLSELTPMVERNRVEGASTRPEFALSSRLYLEAAVQYCIVMFRG